MTKTATTALLFCGMTLVASCNVIFGITEGEPFPPAASGGGGQGGGCADDCNDDNPCTVDLCAANECTHAPLNELDAPDSEQVDDDCLVARCADGMVQQVADDEDVPADGPCATYTCNSGTLVEESAPLGQACDNGVCNDSGDCVGCNVASDCAGTDNQCQTRKCGNGGVCTFDYAADGTELELQTPGDCHAEVCDGAGDTKIDLELSDVPNDNNDCTVDTCDSLGNPHNDDAMQGTQCGNGLTCNANGQCAGCMNAGECGTSNTCITWSCSNGTCNQNLALAGTFVSGGASADCQKIVCDGMGGMTPAADNGDTPNDGTTCTVDGCSMGVPTFTPQMLDTVCNEPPGEVCDGLGHCVECNSPGQCAPPPIQICKLDTCIQHVCGEGNKPMGTLTPMQTTGDCQDSVCDGQGGITSQANDQDIPVPDGNPCTTEFCNSGMVANGCAMPGTQCQQTMYCNGMCGCVECTLSAQCPMNEVCIGFMCQPGGTTSSSATTTSSTTSSSSGGGTSSSSGPQQSSGSAAAAYNNQPF
jgi:hypothetical protein